MDEIIVRLSRVISCYERLRILSLLVRDGERSPTAISRELGLSANALSGHLAKLAAVGLIRRRRSGGWSYCVAESPYGATTLSGKTSRWLCGLLANPERALKSCTVADLRIRSGKSAADPLHRVVFEAATAFADLRRLHILRYLDRSGEATSAKLSSALKMSPWAVGRHTDKLLRRGYLVSQTVEKTVRYRLADKFKTPIHAWMWEIVRTSWKVQLRTS